MNLKKQHEQQSDHLTHLSWLFFSKICNHQMRALTKNIYFFNSQARYNARDDQNTENKLKQRSSLGV